MGDKEDAINWRSWIGVCALLAAVSWDMGFERFQPLATRANVQREGDRAGVERAAGNARSRIEVEAAEIRATAREEWSLPREGATTLALRSEGDPIRSRIRLTAREGEAIEIGIVREAFAEREEEARARLEEMRVERRREGSTWIVTAQWPHKPRERRVGRNLPSYDDKRVVTFEIRAPRTVRLDLSRLNLIGAGPER